MANIYRLLVILFLTTQIILAYGFASNQTINRKCLQCVFLFEFLSSMYLTLVAGEVAHAMYGDPGDVRPMWKRWGDETGLGMIHRAYSGIVAGFIGAVESWLNGFGVVVERNEEWVWL